jgi:hypothetical protein
MILQYKGRKTRNEMKSLPYVKCVIEKKGEEVQKPNDKEKIRRFLRERDLKKHLKGKTSIDGFEINDQNNDTVCHFCFFFYFSASSEIRIRRFRIYPITDASI